MPLLAKLHASPELSLATLSHLSHLGQVGSVEKHYRDNSDVLLHYWLPKIELWGGDGRDQLNRNNEGTGKAQGSKTTTAFQPKMELSQAQAHCP